MIGSDSYNGDGNVKITRLTINPVSDQTAPLLAYVTIVLDDELAMHDVRIIRLPNGHRILSMPCRKASDHCPKCRRRNALSDNYCCHCGIARHRGKITVKLHNDVVFPCVPEFRQYLTETILAEYDKLVTPRDVA